MTHGKYADRASAQRVRPSTLNHRLALPDVRAALEKQGANPGGGTPRDLTAFTEAEIRKRGKVIRDGHIKPD